MKMKTGTLFETVFSALWCISLASTRVGYSPAETPTTGSSGENLEGKMFTLAKTDGITFYPPNFMSTTRRYAMIPQYTTTPLRTTGSTVTGVSVCLRYLTGSLAIQQFLRLGTDNSLYVDLLRTNTYRLSCNGCDFRFGQNYNDPTFQTNKVFREGHYTPWTSFCVIVDKRDSVAQMFTDTEMSIRRRFSGKLAWSGEPVIQFSNFDGQLTDVQVWDYPISYDVVSKHMEKGYYGPQRGSILTWSSINYSLRGNALLEDTFARRYSQVRRKKTQRMSLHMAKRRGGRRQQW